MALSEEQISVVNSEEENVIVVAAAGSGKTTTLTEKVKKLLKDGVDPKSIVVITYTNTAANELISRLKNTKGHRDVFIGTIHSYANKLLKKTNVSYELLTEEKQDELMKFMIDNQARYSTYEDYEYYKKVERDVARGKIKKSEIIEIFPSTYVYKELMIFLNKEFNTGYKTTLKDLCKINNIITFDELIVLATKYFKEIDISLNYLFVDEFQDIGYMTFNFLKELNARHNFFIGDDYQSIFSFNGGDVGIFLSLMKNDKYKTYYMRNNYRCSKAIIDFSNSIINRVSDKIDKKVLAVRDNEGSIEFQSKVFIEKYVSGIKDYSNWFALTRTNKELYVLSAIFKKLKVPNTIIKKATMTDKQMKDALQFNGIKLMTTHSAKGLEEENVMIYGKFPLNPSKSCNDEEIKILYVAITRARDKVVMFI